MLSSLNYLAFLIEVIVASGLHVCRRVNRYTTGITNRYSKGGAVSMPPIMDAVIRLVISGPKWRRCAAPVLDFSTISQISTCRPHYYPIPDAIFGPWVNVPPTSCWFSRFCWFRSADCTCICAPGKKRASVIPVLTMRMMACCSGNITRKTMRTTLNRPSRALRSRRLHRPRISLTSDSISLGCCTRFPPWNLPPHP